jgi:hypothetical protein
MTLAKRGDYDEAERLARKGRTLLKGTDDVEERALTLTRLAEVRRSAGRSEEAKSAAGDALGLCEAAGRGRHGARRPQPSRELAGVAGPEHPS